MKRILTSILMVLLTASPVFAATYYGVNAGGNWGTAATWSTIATKDATRVGGAVVPTASDDCILDDYSGSVTINTASCVAKTLVCTGHTGTLTFTAAQQLSVSGNITFASTMTLAGTGTLRSAATGTITMGTLTFPGNMGLMGSASTVTLAENLNVTGTFYFGASCVMAGAYNITCGTFAQSLSTGGTFQLVSGQTLTATSAINLTGGLFTASAIAIRSVTASSAALLNYTGTAANCKVTGITFTDIDASGSSQVIDNWYGGTLTRTTNITNRTSADIGGSSGSAYGF